MTEANCTTKRRFEYAMSSAIVDNDKNLITFKDSKRKKKSKTNTNTSKKREEEKSATKRALKSERITNCAHQRKDIESVSSIDAVKSSKEVVGLPVLLQGPCDKEEEEG